MVAAKAFRIGLDPDIGLHHGCAEDKIQLPRLKTALKQAYRAIAGGRGRRLRVVDLTDRYGIDLFHKYFLLHAAKREDLSFPCPLDFFCEMLYNTDK